jgi:hypothetical protein
MKTAMRLLAVICYLLAIGAIAEGLYKGIYINGFIVGAITWWLADNFRREAKRYE